MPYALKWHNALPLTVSILRKTKLILQRSTDNDKPDAAGISSFPRIINLKEKTESGVIVLLENGTLQKQQQLISFSLVKSTVMT